MGCGMGHFTSLRGSYPYFVIKAETVSFHIQRRTHLIEILEIYESVTDGDR